MPIIEGTGGPFGGEGALVDGSEGGFPLSFGFAPGGPPMPGGKKPGGGFQWPPFISTTFFFRLWSFPAKSASLPTMRIAWSIVA